MVRGNLVPSSVCLSIFRHHRDGSFTAAVPELVSDGFSSPMGHATDDVVLLSWTRTLHRLIRGISVSHVSVAGAADVSGALRSADRHVRGGRRSIHIFHATTATLLNPRLDGEKT
jgi:hypothetical protein